MKRVQQFTSEADALIYMESLRWPNGPVCPHCSHQRAYYLTPANGVSRRTRRGTDSQRRRWVCAGCYKQFSVTTGTPLHGSHVRMQMLLSVFFEVCASKDGLAARDVEHRYGVSPMTAWSVTNRIRESLRAKAPRALVGNALPTRLRRTEPVKIKGDPETLLRKLLGS